MKTKILFSILALLIIADAFCQNTLVLTFEAEYYGTSETLNQIVIENLTQGCDTNLYYPDNVLDIPTSIGDNQPILKNGFLVSQNYPNPFNHHTQVNLSLPEKEFINITIRDILGREVARFKNMLDRGDHTFTFYPGNGIYYLLTVTGKQTSKTIKMLNAGNDPSSNQQCRIAYTDFNEISSTLKSQKATNDFCFNIGDSLRFTGYCKITPAIYGTDVIGDVPEINTLYTFNVIEGIPCPGTPTVTYEGQTYKTVQIGDQCWMKENLNVGAMIPGVQEMEDNSILEKYCYNDEPDSCAKYGGLINGTK